MLGYFLRHKTVQTYSTRLSVEINPEDTHRALMTGTVAVSGGQGEFIPDTGRIYQLTGQWQIEQGDWKLILMQWL